MEYHLVETGKPVCVRLKVHPIRSVWLSDECRVSLTASTPQSMTTPPDPDPPLLRTLDTIELYASVYVRSEALRSGAGGCSRGIVYLYVFCFYQSNVDDPMLPDCSSHVDASSRVKGKGMMYYVTQLVRFITMTMRSSHTHTNLRTPSISYPTSSAAKSDNSSLHRSISSL